MSSLRTKIHAWNSFDRPLLPVLTVVFIGVFISTLVAYIHTKDSLETLVQGQMAQNFRFIDHEINIQVRELVTQSRLVSQEGVLRLALEDSYLGRSARIAAQRRLAGYIEDGFFERFYLMDMKGDILLASNPDLAGVLRVSDRRYYLQARAGHPALETISRSRVSKRPILVSSYPILGPDGEVLGVLVAIADTANFLREILANVRIGQRGGGYVLDHDGAMLAQPDWAADGDFTPGGFVKKSLESSDGAEVVRFARQGAQRLAIARKNEATGWTLVVEADEAEVLAPATRLAAVGAGMSLLTLALVALALGVLRKVLINLRNSESDQRTLTELSPVGIITFNLQGLPVYMNAQARKILELGEQAPLPESLALADAHGIPLPDADSPVAIALKGGTSIRGGLAWHKSPSGQLKALNINATLLSGQGGTGHNLVATLEDVSERMRSLELLHQSEERFSHLFRLSPDSIMLTEQDSGRVVDVNDTFTSTFGHTREEAVGRTVMDLKLYVDDGQRQEVSEQVKRDGQILNAQVLGRAKDGREFIFSLSSQAMEIGSSRYRMTVVRDITEHVRAVEQLKQSEERFSKLFRLSPEAVLLLDLESTRITDANEAFCTLTGYTVEELIGRTTLDLGLYVNPAQRAAFFERLRRDGHVDNLEMEGRRKDGRVFIGSLSGHGIEIGNSKYLMSLIRDITEVKKMHEIMIQTEKMISVGGIAAGIAHEINNPLGIVLQAAQNLMQRIRPDFPKNRAAAEKLGLSMDQLQQYIQARKLDVFIQDIQAAAVRASGIIRHMLDFSRHSESRRKVCDLPEIIDKAVSLAASDYDLKKSYDFKQIRIVREYGDDLPVINCTETEIEQVLLNLLRNSAQALASAIPPVEGPRIRIRVSGHPDHVLIEIEDNGPGIPAETQRRVFEPFYTTKAPGVGTGLGLSVSYFIVTKSHGGAMTVASEPGRGTTFSITLPTEESLEQ